MQSPQSVTGCSPKTGYVAAHHVTVQTAFRMKTPVSGPPQIQVFVAWAVQLARPDTGDIAYASPSDSAWFFPGAPHVHSGAGGCVMVRDGAATCRRCWLVLYFRENIYTSVADAPMMSSIFTTPGLLQRAETSGYAESSRHQSTACLPLQSITGSSVWPAT